MNRSKETVHRGQVPASSGVVAAWAAFAALAGAGCSEVPEVRNGTPTTFQAPSTSALSNSTFETQRTAAQEALFTQVNGYIDQGSSLFAQLASQGRVTGTSSMDTARGIATMEQVVDINGGVVRLVNVTDLNNPANQRQELWVQRGSIVRATTEGALYFAKQEKDQWTVINLTNMTDEEGIPYGKYSVVTDADITGVLAQYRLDSGIAAEKHQTKQAIDKSMELLRGALSDAAST